MVLLALLAAPWAALQLCQEILCVHSDRALLPLAYKHEQTSVDGANILPAAQVSLSYVARTLSHLHL